MRGLPRRSVTKLPVLTEHRLTAYTVAAGTAGVGILALAFPAEAKIIYTPAHHVIGTNSVFKLDLNHDGKADFIITNVREVFVTSMSTASAVRASGASGNKIAATVQTFSSSEREVNASALKRGARIPNARRFFPSALLAGLCTGSFCRGDIGTGGNWANIGNRYLALKFHIQGKIHYGWARLNVIVPRVAPIKAILTGYAYETIPNKAIVAGQTKGPDDDADGQATPVAFRTPLSRHTTLGTLALGSPGLSIWRRRESPPIQK
jgi:hypothetical protein